MIEKTNKVKQWIIAAIITGIVSSSLGLIISYFTKEKLKLTFSIIDTIPFEDKKDILSIKHIIIENKGDKLIEKIVFFIDLSPASIVKKKLDKADVLNYSDTLTENKYKLSIETLNPHEKIKLSILISCDSDKFFTPDMYLRGKGIIGTLETDKKEKKKTFFSNPIFISVISAYLVVFILLLSRKSSNLVKILHSDNAPQNENLASLFYIYGLSQLGEKYTTKSRNTTYRVESDYITSLALNEKDKKKSNIFKQILLDLLILCPIAKESEAIVYYNLSKICKKLDEQKESKDYLNKASHLAKKVIEVRKKIDPFFK